MNLSTSRRKQPVLSRSLSTSSILATCGGGSTAAEFCGGTTASCAVLWCCGPCSIVNLVVLTVYKLPRGIYRRLRRRRLTKKGILTSTESGECEKKLSKVGSSQFAIHPLESKDMTEEEEDEAVMALEKEMWNKFYSGGFWRSYSQAENGVVF